MQMCLVKVTDWTINSHQVSKHLIKYLETKRSCYKIAILYVYKSETVKHRSISKIMHNTVKEIIGLKHLSEYPGLTLNAYWFRIRKMMHATW